MTGIGRSLLNLLEYALGREERVAIILYGNQRTVLPPSVSSFPFRRIPERLTLWWDQVHLVRALRQDKVNLFLSPYYKAPLLAPCRIIITIHDLLFLTEREAAQMPGWFPRLFPLWARLIARRSLWILTDSEHSKGEILRLLRLPPGKIQVIPLGVGREFHPVEDAATIARVKRRYGIEGEYILYLGNFQPHKNLLRLLTAYRELPRDLGDTYSLVLAGAPDRFLPALQDQVRAGGLERRVRCPGLIPAEDLPVLYSGATACVFPSLAEGFGLPVLEAFACGTPVLTSHTHSLPEVAGGAALLVDPRETDQIRGGVIRLLSDPLLRKELKARGLERAKEFTLERTAGRVWALLRESLPRERG